MNINIKKAYTIFIILFPILSNYSSPIIGVDLGTFFFCMIGCIIFFKYFNEIKIEKELFFILFYTIGITIFSLVSFELYSSEVSILMRMFRFVILLFIFSSCNGRFFDFKYGINLLQKVTLIASFYLIIQYVVYSFTGYILPKFIPGITKLKGIVDSNVLSEYASFYRPTSFFLEPSSFVYFSSLMLVCSLYINNLYEIKNKFLTAVIITIAIILSTSGQGFIVLIVVWGYWIFLLILKKNTGYFRILKRKYIFLVTGIGLLISSNSKIIKNTLGRIFVKDVEAMSAVDARAGGYELYYQLPTIRKIIGVGFGNLPDNTYFSSIADILFTLGIIGLVTIIYFYLQLFLKGKRFQKVLCIVSIVLMAGGGLFTATYLIFYLSFIMLKD